MNIIAMVASFDPQANLARLQSMRTTFMDLTLTAYRKRTSFGLASNRVRMYQSLG